MRATEQTCNYSSNSFSLWGRRKFGGGGRSISKLDSMFWCKNPCMLKSRTADRGPKGRGERQVPVGCHSTILSNALTRLAHFQLHLPPKRKRSQSSPLVREEGVSALPPLQEQSHCKGQPSWPLCFPTAAVVLHKGKAKSDLLDCSLQQLCSCSVGSSGAAINSPSPPPTGGQLHTLCLPAPLLSLPSLQEASGCSNLALVSPWGTTAQTEKILYSRAPWTMACDPLVGWEPTPAGSRLGLSHHPHLHLAPIQSHSRGMGRPHRPLLGHTGMEALREDLQ